MSESAWRVSPAQKVRMNVSKFQHGHGFVSIQTFLISGLCPVLASAFPGQFFASRSRSGRVVGPCWSDKAADFLPFPSLSSKTFNRPCKKASCFLYATVLITWPLHDLDYLGGRKKTDWKESPGCLYNINTFLYNTPSIQAGNEEQRVILVGHKRW